ncbi:MAG: threonylcarbamoyl-AMP synthase [Flavobacteriales bacterium]|nr:threonylcarbamoyl-AMP synthase [Flavobacteriales bacterium]
MLIRIYEENPNPKAIQQVVDCLQKGGVIIYPTDTVYGIGCDINNRKAVERICKIRNIRPDRAQFSFICHDLSHISDYCSQIDNATFKLMKRVLPGPYTFILNATNNVPKLFQSKKRTVGIRIPNNNIPLEIVRQLGNPIMTASVHDPDEIIEYTTDPSLIYERFENQVDMVIDGGYGGIEGSTILDCTDNEVVVLRQGAGPVDEL